MRPRQPNPGRDTRRVLPLLSQGGGQNIHKGNKRVMRLLHALILTHLNPEALDRVCLDRSELA
jgi:hypothetical protein